MSPIDSEFGRWIGSLVSVPKLSQALPPQAPSPSSPRSVNLSPSAHVPTPARKERHLKLQLEKGGQQFGSIWFNRADRFSDQTRVAYLLDANE